VPTSICSRIRLLPSFSYCAHPQGLGIGFTVHASVICHDDYPFPNYALPDRCAGPTGHSRSMDPAFWISESPRCLIKRCTKLLQPTFWSVIDADADTPGPSAYKSTIRILTSSSCPAPRPCSGDTSYHHFLCATIARGHLYFKNSFISSCPLYLGHNVEGRTKPKTIARPPRHR